jgi:hypothetical protein
MDAAREVCESCRYAEWARLADDNLASVKY